jgi:hypothetical protein
MDDLGAYAGELALAAYAPLIDHIGDWCLALFVAATFSRCIVACVKAILK